MYIENIQLNVRHSGYAELDTDGASTRVWTNIENTKCNPWCRWNLDWLANHHDILVMFFDKPIPERLIRNGISV